MVTETGAERGSLIAAWAAEPEYRRPLFLVTGLDMDSQWHAMNAGTIRLGAINLARRAKSQRHYGSLEILAWSPTAIPPHYILDPIAQEEFVNPKPRKGSKDEKPTGDGKASLESRREGRDALETFESVVHLIKVKQIFTGDSRAHLALEFAKAYLKCGGDVRTLVDDVTYAAEELR